LPAAKHHPETKLQALALYSAHGFNETVRRMRGIVPRATLQNWIREAKKNGTIAAPTRNAKLTPELARRKTYNKARRLDLNDRLFYRIEATLKRERNLPTNRLKDLALTYAILTDKRRLEEGRKDGGLTAEDIEQLEKDVRERIPGIRSGGSLRAIEGGKKK
jgi:transposase-like protein